MFFEGLEDNSLDGLSKIFGCITSFDLGLRFDDRLALLCGSESSGKSELSKTLFLAEVNCEILGWVSTLVGSLLIGVLVERLSKIFVLTFLLPLRAILDCPYKK